MGAVKKKICGPNWQRRGEGAEGAGVPSSALICPRCSEAGRLWTAGCRAGSTGGHSRSGGTLRLVAPLNGWGGMTNTLRAADSH